MKKKIPCQICGKVRKKMIGFNCKSCNDAINKRDQENEETDYSSSSGYGGWGHDE